ncbi:sugar transferase [Bacteroides sp.]
MKQLMDYIVAALVLLLCWPLLLYIAIRIRMQGKGSVFYRQERLGKGGVPFQMVKFRTMVADAEEGGTPLLAVSDDYRVTPFGRILRRHHLDELPQFWNVLKGDMSIVGPRPERAYFVQQILEKEPDYERIFHLKPGITSLGMVKFGYANTTEKMIERSRYDLYYLEHYSFCLDVKILLATIKEVWNGKGI